MVYKAHISVLIIDLCISRLYTGGCGQWKDHILQDLKYKYIFHLFSFKFYSLISMY